MVYRGKPSKGCKNCRQRRIRCDRKPAGCGNCARAGQECPGYRNQLDLMFCDETENTVQRHRGSTSSFETVETQPRASSVTSASSDSDGNSSLAFSNLLTTSSDDFALAYCYDHHIIRSHTRNSTMIRDEGVLVAMKAVGMASVAMTTQSSKLAAQARKFYVDALQFTNTALTSKKNIAKDNTLFSVIALSYFESIVGSDTISMDAWLQHIQGTSMLVELRGRRQLETPDGRILFLMASIWLIAMHSRQRCSLSSVIIDMLGELAESAKQGGKPMWRTNWCNARLANLRADVAKGAIPNADDLLSRATSLETEFIATFSDLPPDWQFVILDGGEMEDYFSFPSYSHVYFHSVAAQTWNSMRYGRIVLNLMMIRAMQSPTCTLPSDETSLRLEESRAIIYKMQMDILATVPQFLGASAFHGKEPSDGIHSATDAVPSAPMDFFEDAELAPKMVPLLHTSRGYVLMWNLRMVGELNSPGSEMWKTAIKALKLVGKVLGVSQAFAHVKLLEEAGKHWSSSASLLSHRQTSGIGSS